MLIRHAQDIAPSEITDYQLYLNRRSFLIGMAALALSPTRSAVAAPPAGAHLPAARNERFTLEDPQTPLESITTYNNFWEMGPNKDDPARLAHLLKPRPWTLQIDGHVARPRRYDVEELMRLFPLEERVYRLRCVEGWSMVIPWIGYPLASLIKRVEPTSKARFVEFTTLHDPAQFPGQRKSLLSFSSLEWPYVEGLRLDEALHPLTLLTFGLYGQVLPN
ncbi:MAG TPA: protein-methionine-sulfoxide reductase catalytic subunit MsrP, partial [Verrucomicrobiae bacterium]|nr:protein-methionine-sulfoxide reductase catalytic subunit MsrP [Verrucomicrobiae bacterium]